MKSLPRGGVFIFLMPTSSIPASELNVIKDLYYVQKKHMSQIALQYGVSIDSVISFMRRHDLKRRTPAESNRINFERKPLSYSKKLSVTEEEKIIETEIGRAHV